MNNRLGELEDAFEKFKGSAPAVDTGKRRVSVGAVAIGALNTRLGELEDIVQKQLTSAAPAKTKVSIGGVAISALNTRVSEAEDLF